MVNHETFLTAIPFDEVGEKILGLLESCKEQGSFIIRSFRMAVLLLLLTAASSRRVRRSSDSAAVSQARTNIVRHGCDCRKRENQMIQKYFYKNKVTTSFNVTNCYLTNNINDHKLYFCVYF